MSDIPDQPPPVPRPDLVPIWELVVSDMLTRHPASALSSDDFAACVGRVVEDMRTRDRVGRERYGVPLTTGNGRDHLVDLYQELLDATAYSRAEIEESGSVPVRFLYSRLLDDLLLVRALINDRTARRNM